MGKRTSRQLSGCTEFDAWLTQVEFFHPWRSKRTVMKKQTTGERFWSKVNKTPTCWLWVGFTNRKGYGCFRPLGGRSVNPILAHRYAWTVYKGQIPDGFCVLHSCDVPNCVRVDHLFLGTNLDNVKDCMQKGRRTYALGEKSHFAKWKWNDVRTARRLHAAGISTSRISKLCGIPQQTVSTWVTHLSWKESSHAD